MDTEGGLAGSYFNKFLGAEIIFAGAHFNSRDELGEIIRSIVAELRRAVGWQTSQINLSLLGEFSFRPVHTSWSTALMLGALNFYKVETIRAFQLVPDETHSTIEIPDLSEPWNPMTAPAWKWLHERWIYPIPLVSVGVTNLAALRGERITEVMRWEEDECELFAGAGPDTVEEERRIVPLSILLASDRSLAPIVDLQIGSGLWRDDESDWHPWNVSKE